MWQMYQTLPSSLLCAGAGGQILRPAPDNCARPILCSCGALEESIEVANQSWPHTGLHSAASAKHHCRHRRRKLVLCEDSRLPSATSSREARQDRLRGWELPAGRLGGSKLWGGQAGRATRRSPSCQDLPWHRLHQSVAQPAHAKWALHSVPLKHQPARNFIMRDVQKGYRMLQVRVRSLVQLTGHATVETKSTNLTSSFART